MAYASGGHCMVPWDVYMPHNAPRYFGKPSDYADLTKFVRNYKRYFDGYSEAAVVAADAELAALESTLPGLEAKLHVAALSIGVLLGELPESELGLAGQTADFVASGYRYSEAAAEWTPLAAMPVGLGYAGIAGVPIQHGLYAAAAGTAPIWRTSRYAPQRAMVSWNTSVTSG